MSTVALVVSMPVLVVQELVVLPVSVVAVQEAVLAVLVEEEV